MDVAGTALRCFLSLVLVCAMLIVTLLLVIPHLPGTPAKGCRSTRKQLFEVNFEGLGLVVQGCR